jgi:hypothetical protein
VVTVVTFEVELQEWQAYALATICTRSQFSHFLACSDGEDDMAEAYDMISALSVVRYSLSKALDQLRPVAECCCDDDWLPY